VNYRLNRVRFPAAVPADSRIRGHFALLALRELSESVEATYNHRSEPSGKTSGVAEWIVRYYS
jgi:acyl dehydratase